MGREGGGMEGVDSEGQTVEAGWEVGWSGCLLAPMAVEDSAPETGAEG